MSSQVVSGGNVLHVEDEDASAFLFRAALSDAGIAANVYRVSNGEEALAFLHKLGSYQQAERPSLIVLDLNLPRIDGLSVLAKLRVDEALNSIPVVVLSTSGSGKDREKSLALGARRYIVKPSNFEDLVEAVKRECGPFLDANSPNQA